MQTPEQRKAIARIDKQQVSAFQLRAFGKLATVAELYARLYGVNQYTGPDACQVPTADWLKQHFAAKRRAVTGGASPTIEQPAPTPVANTTESTNAVALFHLPEPEQDPFAQPKMDDDFYKQFKKLPNESLTYFWWQKKAIVDVQYKFDHGHHSIQIIAPTGSGKTFIAGGVINRLKDTPLVKSCLSPHPILYVTRSTIVEKTERDLRKYFGLDPKRDVKVINIEMLRSGWGAARLIKWSTRIVNGQPVIKPEWVPFLRPAVIIWDENQALRREDSIQTQIAVAINSAADIKERPTFQVMMSATPFASVQEARTFCLSTRLMINEHEQLTEKTWTAFSRSIAHPKAPEEYSPAAVERLMKRMDDHIVAVKGIVWHKKAINTVSFVHFKTKEDERRFDDCIEEYRRKKAKLDADKADGTLGNSAMCELAIMTVMRKGCEEIKAPYIGDAMYESWKAGNAPVAAVCFKTSACLIVKTLVDTYKVPRNKIAMIWGGEPKTIITKQSMVSKLDDDKKDLLLETLKASGFSDKEIENLTTLEEKLESDSMAKLRPDLRLGIQSKNERQANIDAFQSGQAEFCIFTFKAGGVGLSLHHSDDYTKFKCRRTDAGWPIEEDIPHVPIRPRETLCSLTYSFIEMVQGLGRAPRISSLSDTRQAVLGFKGTIEEHVLGVVRSRFRCLKKVVRQHESWADIINDQRNVAKYTDDSVEQQIDEELKLLAI